MQKGVALTFKEEKYKTMLFGYGNARSNYRLGTKELEESQGKKDLSVIISADLISVRHVMMLAAKAKSRRGIIRKKLIY